MSRRRSSTPPIIVLAVFAVILFVVGRTAWQWLSADPSEPGATLPEQVEAVPGVAEVRVESSRVPGAGSHRSVESWVSFDEGILADPAASAERLAGVTPGWSSSHWTIEGLGSTAEVHYVSRPDPAPFAWWLQGVDALREAAPGAALACDIGYGSLDCTVAGGDAGSVRRALSTVDDAAVRSWIGTANPDPDQPHGFVVRVGGEDITQP